jgi:hypothetical protein
MTFLLIDPQDIDRQRAAAFRRRLRCRGGAR